MQLAAIYSTLILAMTFVFFKTGEAGVVLQAIIMALVVPVFLQILGGRFSYERFRRVFFIPVTYLTIGATSIVLNTGEYHDFELELAIVVMINVTFVMGVACVIAADPRQVLIGDIARLCAVLMSLFLVYALRQVDVAEAEARFDAGDIHPNWWGMICFGVVCCSLFLRRKRVVFLLCNGMAVYVIYAAQARGALIAACAALGIAAMLFLMRRTSAARRFLTGLAACGALVVVALSFMAQEDYVQHTVDFFVDEVLLVNDPWRGVESGLSGRLEGWSMAIDRWMDSPLVGTGFGTNGEVHNGFLVILSDGGLLFLIASLGLFGLALVRSWRVSEPMVATIAGYMVLMLTYPRSFNLQFAALIFILVLVAAVAGPADHKPGRVQQRPGSGFPSRIGPPPRPSWAGPPSRLHLPGERAEP